MSTVDLHLHSLYSDGSLTPQILVDKAAQLGVKTLALTDHDTISGCLEFKTAATEKGIQCWPAVEMSVQYDNFEIHLLCYKVALDCQPFNQGLKDCRLARTERNQKVIKKLQNLGIPIDHAELLGQQKSSKMLGRLHLAQWLVKNQFSTSIKAAFAQYLGEGQKSYVPKESLSLQEAIKLVHKASGKVFLAHPNRLAVPMQKLQEKLPALVGSGLDGIEVYHPSQTAADSEYLKREFVKPYGLLVSGGSDFHNEQGQSKIGHINQHTRLKLACLSDWFYS